MQRFLTVRLKAELIGLYSLQTVRNECKSPGQLLSFLAQKDLLQNVPEATKLLQLVLTVPATTASVERSFSVLKRLKTVGIGPIQDDFPAWTMDYLH